MNYYAEPNYDINHEIVQMISPQSSIQKTDDKVSKNFNDYTAVSSHDTEVISPVKGIQNIGSGMQSLPY